MLCANTTSTDKIQNKVVIDDSVATKEYDTMLHGTMDAKWTKDKNLASRYSSLKKVQVSIVNDALTERGR